MTGISYEEALSTLTSMFGPPWTKDHLDTLLRHFKGHMEDTVDAILGHGDGDPDVLVARLKATPDISRDEALARQLVSEESLRSNYEDNVPKLSSMSPFPGSSTVRNRPPVTSTSSQASPPKKKGIGTPTDLPSDFLRIPGREYKNNSMSEDEALARMLQNEMFTAQIANNPDLAHLARANRRPISASNVSSQNVPQGPNIMDQLSELGNSAKMQLAKLAAQWNSKNQKPSEIAEQRSLLDDRENDDFFGFAASESATEMEMSAFEGSKKDK